MAEIAEFKLALVGLAGFGDYYPSEISGGMRKRAAIARAMALDPEILFLDEPSAGLDPISSRLLDDLILELRDSLGMTIVIVTHELASIFAIARQLGLPRRRDPDDDRHRPSALAARAFRPGQGAGVPHPRASRSARHERTGSPSPRAIGLFVLGGIVLAVLGLIVFGGSRFFSHGDSYVIYFDESLKGLRRGAPVTFRGVDIGQVTEIRAIYEQDTGAVRVPVTVELRPGALTLTDGMAGGSDVLMDLWSRAACARAWTCRACSPGSC